MTPSAIGFLGLLAILVLIALRIPIAVVLIVVGSAGIGIVTDWPIALNFLTSLPFDFIASWQLSAVPMFLFMGAVAAQSGLSTSIFKAGEILLARLPGGLAVATNFAAALFAASSGSSTATTVAIGRIAIPEMLRVGYDRGLAVAVCASAGTLGSLIPPSIMMIIYCTFTGQSVIALFAAGILPGLLTAFIYAAMIVVRCAANPKLAPRSTVSFDEDDKAAILREVWPLPLLVAIVIGGIYAGVFTPTEAGAAGSAATLVICILLRRMSWTIFASALRDTAYATSAIFFIAIGAIILTRFMALSGVPGAISDFVSYADFGPTALILCAFVVYLVLGCFLEPIGIMLLTIPVLLPALQEQGVNLILFGILMVKYLEIGLLTPPVGLNVFAAKSLVGDEVPLGLIFKGIGWFIVCEVIVVALLIIFPEISLYLPSLIR